MSLRCFKAYDIRGVVPDDLNVDLAYKIALAYAEYIKPKSVVIGRDNRESSSSIASALSRGLCNYGVDVFDLGLCGTEEIYFATFHKQLGGGIMITASHNPPEYNGMKLVRSEARPISGDTGLKEIEAIIEAGEFAPPGNRGLQQALDVRRDYVHRLLRYVDLNTLKPFRVVANSGNGMAGPVIDALEKHLPFEFIKVHHESDGSFPTGVPNPLLPENRGPTITAIRENGADLGVAWDGDFDRCFLFDENGQFVEGYYIVGLLSAVLLSRNAGERIVHDPRMTWNTIDIVRENSGEAVMSKTGHAFMKESMRAADAMYGGEMSGHHYFRDFNYCDSGMIPWLLVAQIMSDRDQPLSELVRERIDKFPASGEINRTIVDVDATLKRILHNYASEVRDTDFTDGLSMEFKDWRLNVRASNTEPLVRLNVESRGDEDLMKEKTQEILALMEGG